MTYPALPARRMPYDNDGTVFVSSAQNQPYTSGATTYPTGAQLLALNGQTPLVGSSYAPCVIAGGPGAGGPAGDSGAFWWFFPEQREISGLCFQSLPGGTLPATSLQGSNDTTNGLDGTWETASITGSLLLSSPNEDIWRSTIATVSFTGPKKVIRYLIGPNNNSFNGMTLSLLHLYGEKAAGQTPNDVIFVDPTNSDAEFTLPLDYGDRPLGTTLVKEFALKNVSTLTANTISIQCNDPDFAISSDGVTYGASLSIASLAAGAVSGTMYCRNTTPAAGSALGPRFARIVVTVSSYA